MNDDNQLETVEDDEETKRERGRPTKLTPEVMETIINNLRIGNFIETAAHRADINPSTVFRWLKAAEEPDANEIHVQFRNAVTRAKAEAESRSVAVVQRAMAGGFVTKRVTRTLRDGSVETEEQFTAPDGRVALEFMSRAFRDRWGKTSVDRVEVTGAGGGAIQVEGVLGIAARLAERQKELENTIEGEVVEDE